jgi:hypothetical protein
MIKDEIKKEIFNHPNAIKQALNEGITLEQWAHTVIANLSSDLLESGEYHLYRGVLNPDGPAKDLLRLYDTAIQELVSIGAIDVSKGELEKNAIRKNIKNVG